MHENVFRAIASCSSLEIFSSRIFRSSSSLRHPALNWLYLNIFARLKYSCGTKIPRRTTVSKHPSKIFFIRRLLLNSFLNQGASSSAMRSTRSPPKSSLSGGSTATVLHPVRKIKAPHKKRGVFVACPTGSIFGEFGDRDRLLLLTFPDETRNVTSCRAAGLPPVNGSFAKLNVLHTKPHWLAPLCPR